MSRHSNLPDRSRDEDAELGFSDDLAGRLRTSTRNAVSDACAPAGLYEQVRARRSRRRRRPVFLGLAAAAAIAVAVLVLPTGPSVPVVDPIPPAGTPSDSETTTPTPEDSGPGPSTAPTPSDPPTPSSPPTREPLDDSSQPATADQAPVLELDAGFTVPRFELASRFEPDTEQTSIAIVARDTSGALTSVEPLVSVNTNIPGIWVRPGSTPDDLVAVVATGEPPAARLSTLRVADGSADLRAWPDSLQPQGSDPAWASGGAWSPDGSAFAQSRAGVATVVTFDGDGPVEIHELGEDLGAVRQWVPSDDPDTAATEFELWGQGLGESGMVALRARRDGDTFIRDVVRFQVAPSTQNGETVRAAVRVDPGVVTIGSSVSASVIVRDPSSSTEEVVASTRLPNRGVPFGESVRLTSVGAGQALGIEAQGGTLFVGIAGDGSLTALDVSNEGPRQAVDWID